MALPLPKSEKTYSSHQILVRGSAIVCVLLCFIDPRVRKMGARQAEGLSPWSRRAPQESDRYPKDFCPFSGRLFEVGVFPPIFFHFV